MFHMTDLSNPHHTFRAFQDCIKEWEPLLLVLLQCLPSASLALVWEKNCNRKPQINNYRKMNPSRILFNLQQRNSSRIIIFNLFIHYPKSIVLSFLYKNGRLQMMHIASFSPTIFKLKGLAPRVIISFITSLLCVYR